MSLKGFHIVFITVCFLLSLFLIAWGFVLNTEPGVASRVTGLSGIAVLLATPIYAVWFLRKSRGISV